ncbi:MULTISPECIES: YajQ family cyclic di-GMP-binding protein [Pseudoalteromonas]|uniref:Nucleotide-binding protein CWC05_00880 n=1 Tax=Pseudoalteromonas ruthenica TaxID=151081 RepID=A0A0F4PUD5_9GAMM|nr:MULTISPECIES: YajQ family cyclic di-GMP-binding protein [Pseudoalteromonas]KJY97896.1 nucleotide-binding protein [Pseudoalteromonas ruthenica]KJZ01922.1 nucleotide-binding protein [Pseudoalteromonas ruthenica]MCF2862821.1 YajQ family cyclic di-GMP-binding protein [Pseudoalteromonas sp. CNAT2-18]MCG7543409.1 YajQ family cyclic di-GMP-binding protein [Pseudoalteromonas sp. MM17-2]MCG7558727.1 YajQ family cyclic di-GMP-binding protein [Pseudoalteromonas sp. CNAT2-18.1]|tara:strand:- start:95397 stop:95879 length:483 start_codon:yes stop_codon:yes gene_type:complete
MPSFDIVSEIEMSEAKNAVENAKRELETRYDFRGVDAKIELKDELIELTAEAEQQVMQLFDMFASKASKRGLDVNSFEIQKADLHGKYVTRQVTMKQGIAKDIAKKLVKLIKDSKIKVQAAIQGEEVRVTGKKRDDLQQVMQLVREAELGQPFQFKNFRD